MSDSDKVEDSDNQGRDGMTGMRRLIFIFVLFALGSLATPGPRC